MQLNSQFLTLNLMPKRPVIQLIGLDENKAYRQVADKNIITADLRFVNW